MKYLLFLGCSFVAMANIHAQTKKYQIANGLPATVQHEPGSKSVQVLLPGVERIELELSQDGSNAFQIKTADYNLDGYRDFALTSKAAAPNAPALFDIYLYHPAEKSFELLEMPPGACENFSNVRVGINDRTLRSSCRTGTKSSLDVFKWSDPFTLELLSSKDNGADAQADQADEKAEEREDRAEQRAEKREQRKAAKEEKEEED